MPDLTKPTTDCDRQGNIAPQTGPEPATPARPVITERYETFTKGRAANLRPQGPAFFSGEWFVIGSLFEHEVYANHPKTRFTSCHFLAGAPRSTCGVTVEHCYFDGHAGKVEVITDA